MARPISRMSRVNVVNHEDEFSNLKEEQYLDDFEDDDRELEPPDDSTITEEAKSEEGGELHAENENPEDEVRSEFSTSLWTNRDSSYAKTIEPWELPSGAIAWDDNDKPVERLLNYAELELTEEEENGLLTDRIIAASCSYLTLAPETKQHIVAKVCLNNKNLNDILILGYHRFLQYIDLSWNNLKDLSPLGHIPYLMYLDVSHNLLEDVLRFNPPWNLTYVNYSYNQVWRIDDLSNFWSLSYLDLSHNKIVKIQGFHQLRYLRHLDLSHNKIERFENLENLRITDLNLEYNLISKFETDPRTRVATMMYLTNLYLNNNLITDLNFLEAVYRLRKLELQNNNISDIIQLSYLKTLRNLRLLDMTRNPVTDLEPYRRLILSTLPGLRYLDQSEIDISEKVACGKHQTYDVQLEAARSNARLMILEQLNDTSIDLDILPVDQGAYPLVILVGPPGSSKKLLVTSLGEKYGEKVHIGKLHTTRQPLEVDKSLLIKITRNEFDNMVKDGKFFCVMEILGHVYGFSRQEFVMAVKNHKLCLTCLDLEAALTIHSYGIQPYLVLTIPKSEEEHVDRLKKNYGAVTSLLGAAYMAEREFISTHTSNVARVRTILEDLVDLVVRACEERRALIAEYCANVETDEIKTSFPSHKNRSTFSTDHGIWSSQDLPTSSETYPARSETGLSGRENRTGAGWTARSSGEKSESSPISFGLQKICSLDRRQSRNKNTDSASTPDKSPAVDEELDEIPSLDTSYSETNEPTFRNDVFSWQESYLGEYDPFSDWSLPFVDWDELHIDTVGLEEAAEKLCEKYLENVMATRDIYLNMHLENPGLFSLCVYSDDFDESITKIGKYLKEVWCSAPSRKPIFDLENDEVYKMLIPKKLERFNEMLESEKKSSADESYRFGTSDAGTINSPRSILSQMRYMGYEDTLTKLT